MNDQQTLWSPAEWREQLRSESEEAWRILFEECAKVCFSMFRNWSREEVDPEDVTQEVLLQVVAKLDEWDEVESIIAFVRKRARWRCVDVMRRIQQQRKEQVRIEPGEGGREPVAPTPVAREVSPELAALITAVRSCEESYPPETRQLIAWFEQPREWVAAQMGEKANNIARRYHYLLHTRLPGCLERAGYPVARIAQILRGGAAS